MIYLCLYCKRKYVMLIENCVRYVDHYEGLQDKNGVCAPCKPKAYGYSMKKVAENDA